MSTPSPQVSGVPVMNERLFGGAAHPPSLQHSGVFSLTLEFSLTPTYSVGLGTNLLEDDRKNMISSL